MTYVDTNILIYLLEGHEHYGVIVADLLEKLTEQRQGLITSVVTITEFLSGTTSSDHTILHTVPRLQFIAFDESLAVCAADLQRKHPALKIGDAIHLATAVTNQASLLLTNDKALSAVASEHVLVKGLDT